MPISSQTPNNTNSKKVHFNRDISKWSIGGSTPTIQRLSSLESSIVSTKFDDASSAQNTTKPGDNNMITVAVRVRPLNSKELSTGCFNALRINEDKNEIILNDRSNKHHKFSCDFVITDQTTPHLDPSITDKDQLANDQQLYVYDCIGKPLLNKAFDGYNVSVFAYGQTGSGKTYSMIGTANQPGLIPRFFEDLFERKTQRDQIVSSTHIEISYYEIYNEKIYDLLRSNTTATDTKTGNTLASANGRNLQIRENPQTGPYIVDLLTLSANSAADAKLWLEVGNKRRATACTNMNQKSSRSHSVFQINLTQMLEHNNVDSVNKLASNHKTSQISKRATNGENQNSQLLQLVTSRINLIDLAGSERINTAFNNNSNSSASALSTPSTGAQMTTSRFKESTCINKSLLTLGKIICLLSERQTNSNSDSAKTNNNNAAMINSSTTNANTSYLPYRESVLTWLLKESLGGNAKTAMLATVNASNSYLDETVCTLRYAAKTACIKNLAHLNRNFRQKYINEFGQELEMNLILPPMYSLNSLENKYLKDAELEKTLKAMEQEWKEKLEEAERLKQKEINDLEKSLIVLYENETRAQNCCLVNLNEDPSLSEKLIYLLKSSSGSQNGSDLSTLVGSDKNEVNIHLTGPLIAPVHCKLWKKENGEYYIQQIDKNYVTYLNGEVIGECKENQLNHGDRIIFGGSHFFRFNNPSKKQSSNQISSLDAQFKDYQFAKNEIERKQNELIQEKLNEALNKCKEDGDLKLRELKQKYEQNIESIKNDLEREKNARKLELEQIKSASHKKLKQIVEKKLLIETKLSKIENDVMETNQVLDKHEKELTDDGFEIIKPNNSEIVPRTPSTLSNRLFLNKLYSDKKNTVTFKSLDQEIIQNHANSNSLFAITLKVTEANKICNILGLEYELKKYELPDPNQTNTNLDMSVNSTASTNLKNYIQAVCVIDKRLNLVTLWNLDTFEYKLNMLRDIYSRFMEEGSICSAGSNTTESLFITDSMDEWQTYGAFMENEEAFSPRIIENAIGRNNDKKSCKRRLSILTNSIANLSTLNTSLGSNLMKSSDNLDQVDHEVNPNEMKRKCVIIAPDQTPQIQHHTPHIKHQRTPIAFSLSSRLKSHDSTNSLSSSVTNSNQNVNMNNQLVICNSFVYATCRDALNDDELQMEDDEDDLDYMDDEDDNNDIKDEKRDLTDKKSNTLPTIDDAYLKCYARLIYNLNKLIEYYQLSEHKNMKIIEESTEDCMSSLDLLNSNNDQPLYCMKIIIIFSQLNQFRPDYWSLVNGEDQNKIKKIFAKINKSLRTIKDSINCLFQSIENNLDSMAKSKYELVINHIIRLLKLHGEYTFLTCSNTFLNRSNYSLNMIDSKFLCEYAKGIDVEFENYLNAKLIYLNSSQNATINFIENIKNFWIECKKSIIFSEESSGAHDLIIDYCNYVLQTHFRLGNIFKLLKHQQELYDKKLLAKLNEQILSLMYSILTNSLSLNTTSIIPKEKTKEWNDSFIAKYKSLKLYFKSLLEENNENKVSAPKSIEYMSVSSKIINTNGSITDTRSLSINVKNDN